MQSGTKIIIGIVVIVALAIAFLGVSNVIEWGGIARGDIVSKVERAIGEHKILRTRLQSELQEGQTSIDEMRKIAIELEVRSEQTGKQIESKQQELTRTRESLAKLVDILAAGEPVTLNGNEYSIDELQRLAEQVKGQFETLGRTINLMGETKKRLDERARVIRTRIADYRQRLEKIRLSLPAIDAEIVALEGVQRARGVMDRADGSFDDLMGRVESTQSELEVVLAVGFEFDQEVWEEDTQDLRTDDLMRDLEGDTGRQGFIDDVNSLLGRD